jgi:3-methyladenine DNA glycosylase/8-oxoguanine DNA glycosylase
VSIRGLGRWTVEWFLARTLARPHAIAAGDLGVRKAISRFVADVDETLSEPDIRHIAEDWGDGGNWATHLLLEQLSEA